MLQQWFILPVTNPLILLVKFWLFQEDLVWLPLYMETYLGKVIVDSKFLCYDNKSVPGLSSMRGDKNG